MDEYKAKAVQTLNVSEIGFNPYDYLAQSTHPTGEAYWYIPLNIQIKWFRAVYPQGGIDIATEKVENGHRVTAYVYAEHDQKLLASAQCEKYVTLERSDTQEWAQFAAKSHRAGKRRIRRAHVAWQRRYSGGKRHVRQRIRCPLCRAAASQYADDFGTGKGTPLPHQKIWTDDFGAACSHGSAVHAMDHQRIQF